MLYVNTLSYLHMYDHCISQTLHLIYAGMLLVLHSLIFHCRCAYILMILHYEFTVFLSYSTRSSIPHHITYISPRLFIYIMSIVLLHILIHFVTHTILSLLHSDTSLVICQYPVSSTYVWLSHITDTTSYIALHISCITLANIPL